MVAPGNVNPKGVQTPAPPGQGRQPVKAARVETPVSGTAPPKHTNTQHTTEMLQQRRNLPVCPAKLAMGGVAVVAVVGYLTLYSKKKPEATALDVAKVASGTATAENTGPRK